MHWTEQKSITLSIFGLYCFGSIIVLTMIFLTKVIDVIVPINVLSSANYIFFIVTLELCLGVGIVTLYFLRCLIKNISNNQTFIEKNIKLLRIVSWLCFVESFILIISATYYYPWIFVAGFTTFVGLIIRVVKNVFCQAHTIKQENDFTI